MSEETLIKPDCIPQEAWDQSGPAASACFLMLVKRLEEVERRLGMNSGNSSMPPSSDRPGQQPESTAKPKSRGKRAGHAGHVKRTHTLIPTEACDRVVHHHPVACSACGAKHSGDDPSPKRHQVTDLPPVKPIVTEHQIHAFQCADCGQRGRGRMPATVPRGCCGPGVLAVITLLSGAFHDGALCNEPKTAETCRRLGNECYSPFVPAHHEGVSPTNNAAEQAQRKSVIFGKLSFGTEERTGRQNLATALSATETCRRVGRRPFDYITDAVKAAFNNKTAPRFTPQS